MEALILGAFLLPVCAGAAVLSTGPVVSSSAPVSSLVLTMVGDIRLDGPIAEIARRDGLDAPLKGVQDELSGGDILFGNLECPITQRGKKTPKTWNFRAKPAMLKLLQDAGFDALNLANNHVWDYGKDGFLDTVKYVKRAKFTVIGAGKDRAEAEAVRVFDVNGIQLGIMGFTSTHPEQAWAKPSKPGVAYSDFNRLADVVSAAKKKCDVLIVSLHGGTELAEMPNDIQKYFGRVAVDAGADMVVGHHPHVLQPVDWYKDKPILYSLGNFLFVSPATGTHLSTIVKAEITPAGVARLDFLPVDVNWGHLEPASASDAHLVFDALDRLGALTQHPERLRVPGIIPADIPVEPPDKKLR